MNYKIKVFYRNKSNNICLNHHTHITYCPSTEQHTTKRKMPYCEIQTCAEIIETVSVGLQTYQNCHASKILMILYQMHVIKQMVRRCRERMMKFYNDSRLKTGFGLRLFLGNRHLTDCFRRAPVRLVKKISGLLKFSKPTKVVQFQRRFSF